MSSTEPTAEEYLPLQTPPRAPPSAAQTQQQTAKTTAANDDEEEETFGIGDAIRALGDDLSHLSENFRPLLNQLQKFSDRLHSIDSEVGEEGETKVEEKKRLREEKKVAKKEKKKEKKDAKKAEKEAKKAEKEAKKAEKEAKKVKKQERRDARIKAWREQWEKDEEERKNDGEQKYLYISGMRMELTDERKAWVEEQLKAEIEKRTKKALKKKKLRDADEEAKEEVRKRIDEGIRNLYHMRQRSAKERWYNGERDSSSRAGREANNPTFGVRNTVPSTTTTSQLQILVPNTSPSHTEPQFGMPLNPSAPVDSLVFTDPIHPGNIVFGPPLVRPSQTGLK